MINVGEKIQDFTLKDQDNKNFSSQDVRGKKMVLSFHPLAFTPVCTQQMIDLDTNMDVFDSLNTVPLGMGVDQQFCKAAWAKEMNIKRLRILADFWPHCGVAHSLGIFREKDGFSERANILVNEAGEVIWTKLYPMGEQPDVNEVIEAIRNHQPE
ncbi:MAG: redoxin domain-containing protein [Candidatus Omnitrophota bacterium]